MELPNQPLKTICITQQPSRGHGDDGTDDNNNRVSHFMPLSGCARTITYKKDVVIPGSSINSWNSPNQFCNLKIEIENKNAPMTSRKKRLDDSCLDDTYETPSKKLCTQNDIVSPDLACVLDSYNLPDVATVYSTTDPKDLPSTVDNTVKDDVQSVPEREADLRRSTGAPPRSLPLDETDVWSKGISHEHEKVMLDLGPVFDFDVDEIMCLTPFDSDKGSDEDFEAVVDNGLSKPSFAHSPTQGHVTKEESNHAEGKAGVDIVGGGRELGEGVLSQQENEDAVSDDAYFSRSYIKALGPVKVMSQAATPMQPHILLSPLVSEREEHQSTHVELGQGPPLYATGSAESSGGSAVVSPLDQSFTQEDVSSGLCGAPLVPVDGAEAALEGAAGEMWCIGAPMLESSVCHNGPAEFNRTCEEKKGHDTLEVTVETSYETTLPLNVQVRSVVVVPRVEQSSGKSTTLRDPETRDVLKPPEKNADKTVPVQKTLCRQTPVKSKVVQPPQNVIKKDSVQKVTKSRPVHFSSASSNQEVKTRCAQQSVPRPVVFKKAEDWQRETTLYVSSVTRHMKESPVAGVTNELDKLMNDVANQGPGIDSRNWQHPSDLTCRNFQTRFGLESTFYTLGQWQDRNYKDYRRFAEVPKVFKRSPVL
ncbi:hypothetical protein DPEC_G00315140 [Dallia pectoralis]|uniref:Uncharacterized protein n=1 Tax=Dallia pectoralis TaxID=75939 RepID=A0ACC2FCK4_DALPE|nr:hypothetical protein DPEC_G00315140 [Dallia pectoralis]